MPVEEMKRKLLIYGVSGYMGGLISRLAYEAGLPHVGAGRTLVSVFRHAKRPRLRDAQVEPRTFALKDTARVRENLDDIAVVLNCAGPFEETARPFAEACLATGTHYVDISADMADIRRLSTLDIHASEAGVTLLPGAGYAVVPTDCVAAQLHQLLPDAAILTLATWANGRLSRGRVRDLGRLAGTSGRRMRSGRLTLAEAGAFTRAISFGAETKSAVLDPWRGDNLTAYLSTGVKNIEIYTALPPLARWYLAGRGLPARVMRRVTPEWLGLYGLASGGSGPSARKLRQGRCAIRGDAHSETGGHRTLLYTGPHPLLLTAHAALGCARKAMDGNLPSGFQTPSLALGPDFILEIPGMARQALPPDGEAGMATPHEENAGISQTAS